MKEEDFFDFAKHPNNHANWMVDIGTWLTLMIFEYFRYTDFGWRDSYDVTVFTLWFTGAYSALVHEVDVMPRSRFWIWVIGDGEKLLKPILIILIVLFAALFTKLPMSRFFCFF